MKFDNMEGMMQDIKQLTTEIEKLPLIERTSQLVTLRMTGKADIAEQVLLLMRARYMYNTIKDLPTEEQFKHLVDACDIPGTQPVVLVVFAALKGEDVL